MNYSLSLTLFEPAERGSVIWRLKKYLKDWKLHHDGQCGNQFRDGQNVAIRLGDLVENVVFLGGASTALLITDTAASDARATEDVDVIVEIATTAEYHRISEQLRDRGFREDTSEDAPLSL